MKRNVLFVLIIIGLCLTILGQRPELVVQTGNTGNVDTIEYSPDGTVIASGQSDGEIKLWNSTNLTELRNFPVNCRTLAFSPDGKVLASGGYETDIYLWDLKTGNLLKKVKGHTSVVLTLAYSPDGKYLVTGGGEGDSTVRLWDVKTGKELKKFIGHRFWVNSVEFSPDGKTIASSSFDGTIKLWSTTTGQEIKTFKGHNNDVLRATFSPKGKILASSGMDRTIMLWNIETGEIVKKLQVNFIPSRLTYTPDGEMLAFGNDFEVNLLSIQTGAVRKIDSTATIRGKGITFSRDNKTFVTGIKGGIAQWNIQNGRMLKASKGFRLYISSVESSPNGKILASIVGETVKFLDLTSGLELESVRFETLDSLHQIAFSPDNKLIAVSGCGVQLFDLQSQKTVRVIKHNELLSSEIKKFSCSVAYPYEENGNVHTVAFSPDGKLLASGGGNRIIKLWDTKNGQELLKLTGHSSEINSLMFSPEGKKLASSTWEEVKIWDVETGSQIKNFKVTQTLSQENPYPFKLAVSFSPDGKIIAAATYDKKTIKMWNADTGQEIPIPFSLPSWLKFNDKHTSLHTANLIAEVDNGFIKIKNEENNQNLVDLYYLNENDWLAITPEGFFDGTPNAWKQLIWRFNNNTFDYGAIELYFNEFFYPNLLQDILAGKSPQPKAGQELEKIDRRQPKVEISSIDGKNKTEVVPNQISTDQRTGNIVVEVTDNTSEKKQPTHNATSGAQDLRLFRNGSLVKRWNGDVFEKSSGCEKIQTKANEPRRVRCAFETAITAGVNGFTAYAFNSSNVKSNDDAASIEGKFPKKDGTLYVLAIGVNKYVNSNYNLNFAVPDVIDIGKAIEAGQNKLRTDANLKQYSETRIITLKDETATKENILLALDRFTKSGAANALPEKLCANLSELLCTQLKAEFAKIKPTEPEDALVIYFAGHGTSREQRFYLIPHNFTGEGEDSLIKQSVSDTELNNYLEKVDAGKLLMVIDACQSGQALGGNAEGRAPMNSKGLAQLAYDKGMLILTATQSQQSALEAVKIGDKKIEHGLLTYALLEALSNKEADKDNNQQIWEREWFDFAVGQVPILQREAMTQRSLDLKNGVERSDVFYVGGDKATDPNNRGLQTPRVFYRREPEIKPFILANQ